MKYTFRTAHLKEKSPLVVGEVVKPGDLLGYMGSTGDSTGDHNHSDVIEGAHSHMYRMSDIGAHGVLKASPEQLLYFFEDDAFYGVLPVVTTPYLDLSYWKSRRKYHYGFDTIPRGWTDAIEWPCYWARSERYNAVCLRNEWDNAYGWHVNIGFEV